MAHGLRKIGEVTDLGTIEAVSLTAYRIDGTWVPFSKVDGPYGWVSPLVTFGGAL